MAHRETMVVQEEKPLRSGDPEVRYTPIWRADSRCSYQEFSPVRKGSIVVPGTGEVPHAQFMPSGDALEITWVCRSHTLEDELLIRDALTEAYKADQACRRS